MKNITGLLLMILFITSCSPAKNNSDSGKSNSNAENASVQNFYSFSAVNMQGKEIGMSDYKGKVVLVVNTASKCGYTPQFTGLEELYRKYKNDGLIILGFPCNQFGNQDSGSNKEILDFCQANYGVTFPMFEKIEVNGENAHPIYKYLKNNIPNREPSEIKWNFTKFLIDKSGKPIKRYESKVKPEELGDDIRSALKEDI
ncbi:MAG: glutathione peroxidase [Paludibacteraceae bacterium]